MAMRKWSLVEEELRKAYLDPRLIKVIGEIWERLKVHHQQQMQVVEFVDANTNHMQAIVDGFGAVDKGLKKLGIKEQIEQMDSQDDDPDDTTEFTRKN